MLRTRGRDPVSARELTPETQARLRRLAAARRDVAALVPANVEQGQLVGLLLAILGYMERNLCKPGRGEELDRWWRVLAAYRRALEVPELVGPRRLAALEKLMDLDAARLLAVARRGRLSRRMPKKKRRERAWEAWRALV